MTALPTNMIHTIKNYDVFEKFFFHREKIHLQQNENIENEIDMESFLRYNKWCNSMVDCKEEFWKNDSNELFFFAVVPYCEWQDFEAPTSKNDWILKFPAKWKIVRERFQCQLKFENRLTSSLNNLEKTSIAPSIESNNGSSNATSSKPSTQPDSELRNVYSLIDTKFLQVDSMHAASLINLIKIGDQDMLYNFEKHYFIEYGKFGVVLKNSNWAWFELDLLRASQEDIDFLIKNKKLSISCKHISYEEHLQIVIAKPSWLGKQFIPLFDPLKDVCLLSPPKHAVKESYLKIANDNVNQDTISLF